MAGSHDSTAEGGAGIGASNPGFATAARTAVAAVRDRPACLVPFLLAGIVGAASTLARLETPYPVGVSSSGTGGSLPIPLLPRLEPTVELAPTVLLGLRPEYATALVGWQVALAAATAVAFGVGIWLVAPDTDGLAPPAARIGWLAACVLAVQAVPFGMLYAARIRLAGGGLGLAVLTALAAGALLLVPASIVLGGNRPGEAARESLGYAGARPFSSAGLVISLGVLAALPTALGPIVPGFSGLAVGTVASATVAGTAHAAVVAGIHADFEGHATRAD